MPTPVEQLLATLDLEPIEVNVFRGRCEPTPRERVFGGQVAGQAMMAAGRTIDLLAPHSMHAYFLRPGDPDHPILYEVDRIRDGRSFATRRVVAIQHGQAIFNASISFHKQEEGYTHQLDMPEVPGPEALPTWHQMVESHRERLPEDVYAALQRPRAIDLRYVTPLALTGAKPEPPRQQVWLKASGVLPDDPWVHRCAAAYASDMTLIGVTLRPHARSVFSRGMMMASLDHALWLHASFRMDEWLLYDQTSPFAGGARGLAFGHFFTRDGRLVASMAQEGLMRRVE